MQESELPQNSPQLDLALRYRHGKREPHKCVTYRLTQTLSICMKAAEEGNRLVLLYPHTPSDSRPKTSRDSEENKAAVFGAGRFC